MDDKSDGFFFEVKITPEAKTKSKNQVEIRDEVLVLAPFNSFPKLHFENVKVGVSQHQNIIVRNPNDVTIEVTLDRLPPTECGLNFSDVNFSVGAHEQVLMTVTWTPPEPGKWRHVIQVKNNYRLKLDIIITCTSVDPNKGKKKNIKPLRAQNATSDVSLIARKGSVRSHSYSKIEGAVGKKKKSPVNKQSLKMALTGDRSKQKQEYNLSNENFTRIIGNRLPPCTVQATPPRRETYFVKNVIGEANKENAAFVKVSQKTKSTSDISECMDLRHNRLFKKPGNLHSMPHIPSVLATPPLQKAEFFRNEGNIESESKEAIYNSHPHHVSLCTIGRERIRPEGTDTSKHKHLSSVHNNFLDRLESLTFSPTPLKSKHLQENFVSKLRLSSPEADLPPCNVSPTPDRRKTFAVSTDSRLEESQLHQTEELLLTRRVKRVLSSWSSTKTPVKSLESDKFSDSLEESDDVFTEIQTKQWSEYQVREFSTSESSSGLSSEKYSELVNRTPKSKMGTTGLTPVLNSLNFNSQDSLLHDDDFEREIISKSGIQQSQQQRHHFSKPIAGKRDESVCKMLRNNMGNVTFDDLDFGSHDSFSKSPVNFSLLPPTEDTRRCSTIMKKIEQAPCTLASGAVCKDLFPSDGIENMGITDVSLSPDHLNRLSSGTFVKSESSFPDSCFQESSGQQNVSQSDSQSGTKHSNTSCLGENSAQSIIEAGLWVTPASEKSEVANVTNNAYFQNLETITEENKCVDIFEVDVVKVAEPSLSLIPVKQKTKSEKEEFKSMFLEISPPKRELFNTTTTDSDSLQIRKPCGVSGWSKTSVKSKNYPRLNVSKGASCDTNISSTSSESGKKRHPDNIQTSEILSKRRIMSDGSISYNSSSTTKGTSLRQSERKSSIPRRALTKLSLSTSKKKQEVVKLHNPDAILNKLANPSLFEATTTSEPFTTSSVYYDEEWMVQQEKEFTKWLNSLLTPPEELDSTTALPKVDVAELWSQSCRKQEIDPAPTREMVSSKYHTHHRLDALRKAAYSLFRSPDIAQILSKVAVHVEKKLIAVRSDRDLHLDFGLKCKVMHLLLGYNPLWLRIGLETIYGQVIPLESNSDVRGLAKFIATRLLSDPYTEQQHSHPTVIHLYLPGFEDAMKKFTLKKFLLLVYFLDKAKEKKLICHDPCLFCKNAEIKDSRELLLAFSRELLSGVGDITKQLKSLGYIVSQNQTYLDEFEYAVTCLGTDLRDGIRLTRVMEIILQNRSLSRELRVPAVSRLQKIHNVAVALTALKNAGYILTGDITAKDICDGHREKTLSLLWQIIYKFQAPRFSEAAKKIQDWWRHQALKLEICRRIRARKLAHITKAAIKIQSCWRGYCARKEFKILKVQEKAKLLAYEKSSIIIQKNWRMHIQRKSYCHMLKSVRRIQSWYRNVVIVRKERAEFLKRRQTLVNFQALCRGFLFRKRLGSLQRTAAALKIQTWYRRQVLRRKVEFLIPIIQKCIEEKRISSAVFIQNKFRATKLMWFERQQFIKLKHTVISVQRRFRANRVMMNERKAYQLQKSAAVAIQRRFRATLLMKIERERFLNQKHAATVIQRRFRAMILMKKQMYKYQLQKSSAILIQTRFRAMLLMRLKRQHFLQQKFAATVIQRRFRATNLMKEQKQRYLLQKSAVIIIQQRFRAMLLMHTERKCYLQQKSAAVIIQRQFRAKLLMKTEMQRYQVQKAAATLIQNRFRATILMRSERQNFLKLKHAATVIQRRFRAMMQMKKQKQKYLAKKAAATLIQNKFRATIFMRSERQNFLKLKHAAKVIQRRFRAVLQMKEQKQKYLTKKAAATLIQNKFRATILMRSERQNFLKLKHAATVIQRRFKAMLHMKEQKQKYQIQKAAATLIQRKFRATILMRFERENFLILKFATIVIQRRFKAKLQMKEQKQKYQVQKAAANLIQNKFRATMLMRFERENFLKLKFAATIIQRRFKAMLQMKEQKQKYQVQKAAATLIQNKFRAKILMRSERENFLKLKHAAIVIQRRFIAVLKMKEQKQKYLAKKAAATLIQNKFRATMLMQFQRDCFLKQKRAAIVIQRRFRAMLLMKAQKQKYQLQKSAIVLIQNKFRATMLMRIERQIFLKQKFAAVLIQRRFRATLLMKKQMQKYQLQKSSAILIQNKFRATKLMQLERHCFFEKKRAAVIIQRKFRAFSMMKKQKQSYRVQRCAAIAIQQRFRATLLMQAERRRFLEQKSAALVIQRRFRARQLMKVQMHKFQLQKSAASLIQSKFRAVLLMRYERQHFLEKKSAAIVIQRRFRAMLLMKAHVQKYKLWKSAAILIQNKFRATMLMQTERRYFLKQRSAVITIQRRYRATLLMKSQRQRYQQQKSAAIFIQNKFRTHLLMVKERKSFIGKKTAVQVIQRWFRAKRLIQNMRENLMQQAAREEHRREIAAATKIQAFWRGYRERKTGTQDMVNVRERALSSIRNALPERTLKTRSIAAMKILVDKISSGRLIWALMELDTITQLSPKLCVDIASSNVVKKIYKYIKDANRSEVDKEMCTVATKVLINIAKYGETATSVWEVTGSVNTIMNLMSVWCGKNDTLFCNCCTLLWLFAQDPEKAVEICKISQVPQKLAYFHKQLKQKQDRTHVSTKCPSTSSKETAKFIIWTSVFITISTCEEIVGRLRQNYYVTCITEISDRYFKLGRTLVISYKFKEDRGLEQTSSSGSTGKIKCNILEEVSTLDMLLHRLHHTLRSSVIISKPHEDLKRFEVYDKHSGYIIWTSDSLNLQLHQLKSFTNSWNPRARFLVVLDKVQTQPRHEVRAILEKLRQWKVVDVVVLVPNSKKQQTLDLYSWFPYQLPSGECGGIRGVILLDKWSNERGCFLKNADLYPPKIPNNLGGCPFIVSTMPLEPHVMANTNRETIEDNTKITYTEGHEIRLFNFIEKSMNVTTVFTAPPKEMWGIKYKNGSWSGILGEAIRGVSDIAMCSITLSYSDIAGLEYTIPFDTLKLIWAVPRAKQYPRWSNMIRVFKPVLWLLLVTVMVLGSIFMKYLSRYGATQDKLLYGEMTRCLSTFWAILLGVSLGKMPLAGPIRL